MIAELRRFPPKRSWKNLGKCKGALPDDRIKSKTSYLQKGKKLDGNTGKAENTIEILPEIPVRIPEEFGQNFLIDTHVLEKIIAAAGVTKDDCVLEIGPWNRHMTQYLAESARHVIAVEIDQNLILILRTPYLLTKTSAVINKDILKVDIQALAQEYNGGRPIKVVSESAVLHYHPNHHGLFMETSDRQYHRDGSEAGIDRMQVGPGTKDYGTVSGSSVLYGALHRGECSAELLYALSKCIPP